MLVRHGSTTLNAVGNESAERIRGWRDIPLNAAGREDARRVAKELADAPIAAIYSSPLSRAMDTALAIKAYHRDASGPHAMVSIMPWQLGHMQGQEVRVVLPVMNSYVKSEDRTPPGGEPFVAFRKRFLSFLKEQLDRLATQVDDSIVAFVTHSRGLQVTKAWVDNGAPNDLSISVDAMLNYEEAAPPGGHMWLSAKRA